MMSSSSLFLRSLFSHFRVEKPFLGFFVFESLPIGMKMVSKLYSFRLVTCALRVDGYLKGYEEGDGFHAVVASVHVVAHKQIVGVRGLST